MDRKKFLSICKRGGKVKFEGHEYEAVKMNGKSEDIYGHCIQGVLLKDDATNTLLTVRLERVEECGTGEELDK